MSTSNIDVNQMSLRGIAQAMLIFASLTKEERERREDDGQRITLFGVEHKYSDACRLINTTLNGLRAQDGYESFLLGFSFRDYSYGELINFINEIDRFQFSKFESELTPSKLEELVEAKKVADQLESQREIEEGDLSTATAGTITRQQQQILIARQKERLLLIKRQQIEANNLANKKIEELVNKRKAPLSKGEIAKIRNFYDSAIDSVTKQIASGNGEIDLNDFMEKKSYDPEVQEILNRDDFTNLIGEAKKLASNEEYVRIAQDIVIAKHQEAPTIENVIDVFREIDDPYRQDPKSYDRALERAVQFASNPQYDVDAAFRESLGLKDSEFLQIDLSDYSKMKKEVIEKRYGGDVETQAKAREVELTNIGRLNDPEYRGNLTSILEQFQNGRLKKFTSEGILTTSQTKSIVELYKNCIGKGPLPDFDVVLLSIAAGKDAREISEMMMIPAGRRAGFIPGERKHSDVVNGQLDIISNQLKIIENNSVGTSLENVVSHSCDPERKNFLLNRASFFYIPQTNGDLSFGELDNGLSFVTDGYTGAGFRYFRNKMGSKLRQKASGWLIQKGGSLALKAGGKGLQGLVGKGMQKLGLAVAGKLGTTLGLAALPTGVTQVLAAAKMVFDVAEMGLNIIESSVPGGKFIGGVFRAFTPVGQLITAKQFFEKHWKSIAALGIGAALAGLAALTKFVVSHLAMAGNIMMGLGIATGNPILIAGGAAMHIPQAIKALHWIGGKLSAAASSISNVIGSAFSTSAINTVAVTVPLTALGVTAFSSLMTMQTLMAAFSMPPFDKSTDFLAGNLNANCEDVPAGFPSGWPVASGQISQGVFGKFSHFTNMLNAVDFIHPPGVNEINYEGTPVYATHAGIVVNAGPYRNYGTTVVIKDASGYQTDYAHLSAVFVSVGDSVNKSKKIGEVGSSNTNNVHLHYEIEMNELKLVHLGCLLPVSEKDAQIINTGCDNNDSVEENHCNIVL